MKNYKGKAIWTTKLSTSYGLRPYLPSEKLVEAVNLAMILQRPLLLKGEPGCGKSRLGEAVAAELFGVGKWEKNFFRWNVKSTSKAQDGLYTIDNLQRLQDANFKQGGVDVKLGKEGKRYKTKGTYIELGVLGQAFQLTHELTENDPPPVILIDEIDKADIDFPNDLLLELDKMEFEIPEIKERGGKSLTITSNKKLRPLFIITSNDEKPLPAAFLRRCLFHYIDFTEIKLFEIIEANYGLLNKKLINDSIDEFKKWRKMIDEQGSSNKNVSTSELLDWMRLIEYYHSKDDPSLVQFKKEDLPVYYQSLLKDVESIQLFKKKENQGS